MHAIDLQLAAPPQGPQPKAVASPPQPVTTPPQANSGQPDELQLRQAIEATNAALKQISSDLEFAQDASTGQTVVRVIDSDTQQVIRQFPSEEMLAIARTLDRMQGILIRQKA